MSGQPHDYPGGIRIFLDRIDDYFSSREAASAVLPCDEKLDDETCEKLALQQLQYQDAQNKAALASAVYEKPGRNQPDTRKMPEGFRPATQEELIKLRLLDPISKDDMLTMTDSKFGCEVYKDEKTGKFIVAFKGSEFNTDDWQTNFSQSLGLETRYYSQAINIAKTISGDQPGNVEFIGHSLGGGLASAAAGAANASATTFNSANLHPNTLGRANTVIRSKPPKVNAYYVAGEILSLVQDNSPLYGAVGRRIPVPPDLSPTDTNAIKRWAFKAMLLSGPVGAVATASAARAGLLHQMSSMHRSLATQRANLLALQRLKGCIVWLT